MDGLTAGRTGTEIENASSGSTPVSPPTREWMLILAPYVRIHFERSEAGHPHRPATCARTPKFDFQLLASEEIEDSV